MSFALATRASPHSDIITRRGEVVRTQFEDATNSLRRFSLDRFDVAARHALPLVAAVATGDNRRRSMQYYKRPVVPISPVKTVALASRAVVVA